jgi:hypothetical protein
VVFKNADGRNGPHPGCMASTMHGPADSISLISDIPK